ncbi:MAG: type I 3-dehydroquinate dehydratase [Raoultibacter sp.]|jgi:3-dehydroquinate dehydratase-1
MQALKVRNIVLGQGMPSICVPLTEQSTDELISVIEQAQVLGADLVEWRVDFFNNSSDIDAVCAALCSLRAALGEMPLIFTFRRKVEGGNKAISESDYCELISSVAQTGYVDLMDIEYSIGEAQFNELASSCKAHDIPVIGSHHNFELTPDAQFIVNMLATMEAHDADITKIAVMASCTDDVLTLLEASNEFAKQAQRPFVAISMGNAGALSRLSGEMFGSVLTFASANKASAPGQMSVTEVRQVLSLFHTMLQ